MGSFDGLIKVFGRRGAAELPVACSNRRPQLRPHIRAPIMRAFQRPLLP